MTTKKGGISRPPFVLLRLPRRGVEYLEQAIGCHIGYVSVGAERESLIVR